MTDKQILEKVDEGVRLGRKLALIDLKIEIIEMKSNIKGEPNDYDDGFVNALNMVLETIEESEGWDEQTTEESRRAD